ncbi:MAG: RNA polymerase sigma factor, partial [Limisphaerales bacterium]
MTDEAQRLGRFVANGDQEAFGELVTQHFDLVYSTALRQLNGDTHLAEDVAQTVFTDLARKARFLTRYRVLSGWLHQAARFAAGKVVRTEQRRRAREKQAVAMQNLDPEST